MYPEQQMATIKLDLCSCFSLKNFRSYQLHTYGPTCMISGLTVPL